MIEWNSVFKEHCFNVIQPPQIAKLNALSTNVNDHIGQLPPSPSSPTLKSPFKSKFIKSTLLFQIELNKLEQVYIPEAIPSDYLRNPNAFLGLQLRLTLFDSESNQFYGSTYKTSGTLDIRAATAAADDSSIDDASTKLLARRFSVPFADINWDESSLYMHTSMCTQWVVCVVELVFVVDAAKLLQVGGAFNAATARSPTTATEASASSFGGPELEDPFDYISGGWCLFWPFNASRNGLDIPALTAGDQNLPYEPQTQTVDIYRGTPRVLVFIAPLLRGALQGYPVLTSMIGSSLLFKFKPVEDALPSYTTTVMRENMFFSPSVLENELPQSPRSPKRWNYVVSSIALTIFPGRQQFEETLLKNVAKAFYESNPEVVPAEYAGDFTNLPLPFIFERRMHVGLHNGYKFVAAPTTVSLSETESDLDFGGVISLDHPIKDRCAVLFAIEYRLMIGIQELKLEKSKLAEIAQSLGISRADPKLKELGIERGLLVGWGSWDTETLDQTEADPVNRLSLSTQTGPNPFRLPIYSAPTVDTTIGEDGQTETLEQAAQLVLMFKCDSNAAPRIPSPAPLPAPVEVPAERPVKTETRDKAVSTSPPPAAPVPIEIEERPQPTPQTSIKITSAKNIDGRLERSRLSLAGFDPFYDAHGKKLQPSFNRDGTDANMALELKDINKVNSFIFRFLGVSVWHNTDSTDQKEQLWAQLPKNVYFSFQFYNLPMIVSDRVHLYTGMLPLKSKFVTRYQNALAEGKVYGDCEWPAVFWQLGASGMPRLENGFAGTTCSAAVDLIKDFRGFGNLVNYSAYRTRFLKYMRESDLYIDIWDGDSLMHLGVAKLPLASLLRQGQSGICYQTALEIHSSTSSNATVLGRLHIDVANIGKLSTLPDTPLISPAIVPVVANFRDGLKNRGLTTVKMERLQDSNAEVRSLLVELQQSITGTGFTDDGNLDSKVRKLKKFEAALGKADGDRNELGPLGGGGGLVGVANEYQKKRELHHKELQTVQLYRERIKSNYVGQSLLHQITSVASIATSVGEAVYLEYVLVNPYSVDHTFTVSFSHSSLRVLTDAKEWRHFRKLYGIVEGVEDKLINIDQVAEDGSQSYQVFLYGNETLAIPFVYQSFEIFDSASAETIAVAFWNKNKHPVSLLELHVTNDALYPVSRVFRSTVGEGDPLRLQESVCLSSRSISGPRASGMWMRCIGLSNKTPIAYSLQEQSSSRNVKHWSLKINCEYLPNYTGIPTALNSKLDTVAIGLLYEDEFYSQLSETWAVICGQLHRVDINTILGQPVSTKISSFNSKKTAQMVQCYTSTPDSVTLETPEQFIMEAESLTEINLLMSPSLKQAVQRTEIHLVSKTAHELCGGFLVNVHPMAPTVTKSFHLQLPLNASTNKRVSYSNAYNTARLYYLKSSRPDLLAFRESTLSLQPRQTAFIHMKFLPCKFPTTAQLYVFINDDNDELEECLLIQANYS